MEWKDSLLIMYQLILAVRDSSRKHVIYTHAGLHDPRDRSILLNDLNSKFFTYNEAINVVTIPNYHLGTVSTSECVLENLREFVTQFKCGYVLIYNDDFHMWTENQWDLEKSRYPITIQ